MVVPVIAAMIDHSWPAYHRPITHTGKKASGWAARYRPSRGRVAKRAHLWQLTSATQIRVS
jgi:hypothetical protein